MIMTTLYGTAKSFLLLVTTKWSTLFSEQRWPGWRTGQTVLAFFMAAMLFLYDQLWMRFFVWIGVLKV